jgi:hypothetical protein
VCGILLGQKLFDWILSVSIEDIPVGTRAADVAVAANGGDLLMLEHGDDWKRGSETTGHAGDDRNPHSSPSCRRGGQGELRMRAVARRPSR